MLVLHYTVPGTTRYWIFFGFGPWCIQVPVCSEMKICIVIWYLVPHSPLKILEIIIATVSEFHIRELMKIPKSIYNVRFSKQPIDFPPISIWICPLHAACHVKTYLNVKAPTPPIPDIPYSYCQIIFQVILYHFTPILIQLVKH